MRCDRVYKMPRKMTKLAVMPGRCTGVRWVMISPTWQAIARRMRYNLAPRQPGARTVLCETPRAYSA